MEKKSAKKISLLRIYWAVRQSMDIDDISELLILDAEFEDPNMSTKDRVIMKRIIMLIDAMDNICELNTEDAIPLDIGKRVKRE